MRSAELRVDYDDEERDVHASGCRVEGGGMVSSRAVEPQRVPVWRSVNDRVRERERERMRRPYENIQIMMTGEIDHVDYASHENIATRE